MRNLFNIKAQLLEFTISPKLKALAIAGGILSSTVAFADLTFCNRSTFESITTAVAYYDRNSNSWISKGWWTLKQGECKRVIGGGRLTNRFYYAHGHSGNSKWGDNYSFCTTQKAFELYDANLSCVNGQFEPFISIDTEDYDHYIQNFTG